MKEKTAVMTYTILLFVFVFAAFVTIHAKAPHDCSKTPCDEYDCCYNDYSDWGCWDTYGVWYQGECHCDWMGANPNNCVITGCNVYRP